MSYKKRVMLLFLLDSIIVFSAIYAVFVVLYASDFLNSPFGMFHSGNLLLTAISLLVCHHVMSYKFRLYDKAWEYASVTELITIFISVTLSVILSGIIVQIVEGDTYFRALVIAWMAMILLIGGSRFIWRVVRDKYGSNTVNQKRALIIGAGSAGSTLVRQLILNPQTGINPVAFLDDNKKKNRLEIHGLTVYGDILTVNEIVKKMNIEIIIIAIPSLTIPEMKRIYQACADTKIKVLIMPNIEDVMLGKVSSSQFRDVQVEDLLGRETIKLDIESISERLKEKTVLVTGAGGSIGSEITRQISQFGPKKIILLGHGENSIYQIDMELRNLFGKSIEIIPIIADVQDRSRIFEVVNLYRPEIVYHAAAHKHVPLMEYNPKEAIKNNIIGTRNVAEAADTFGAESFVMVSTDKAVNPTNVMGSTKRIAEMIVQQLAMKSATKFVCVRFGNVLGSRGSVIPLFKKQIQAGGPVTVTSPEITRYFMTIPEASRLVIQAGTLARGGEIFVLDMGEPVKIVDLAENLIRLSGYKVEEIGIEFTGIRPGEKMFEELLNESEVHKKEVYPKIFIGKTNLENASMIEDLIMNLDQMDEDSVKKRVLKIANPKKNKEEIISEH
ncbi:MAG: polysaccharide biosynthesis protein EpsC [Bacillales bacterium]|nr:polysaccharide biosynthesis protein EpsC [Bacillales bacterium]